HIMREWKYSGPDRGVGSKAQVKVSAAGRTDTVDIEVVSAKRPSEIVERNIGAGGSRVANGTYRLAELPDGGTNIVFEYAWRQVPLSERLASPLIRATLRRANEQAMQRLAEQLTERLVARNESDAPAEAA